MSRPRSSPTGPATAAPIPVTAAAPPEPRYAFCGPPDELQAAVARAERSLVRALLRAGHSGGVPFDRAVGGTFDGATPLPPAAYAWAVDLLRHRGLITTAPSPPPSRPRHGSLPGVIEIVTGQTKLVPGVAARVADKKLVRLELERMPPELRQQVRDLGAVRQHQIEEVEPGEALMKALEPYFSPESVPADAVAGVPHWDGESQLTVEGKTYTIGKRKRDLRTMLGRFQGTSPTWQRTVIFDNKRLADKPARRAREALRALGCPLRIYAQGSGVNIRWDCEPDPPSQANADTGVG